MSPSQDRRDFLKAASTMAGGLVFASTFGNSAKAADGELPFKISLAQWSLHRALKGGKMDNLDFAKTSKELGIHAIEYVNQFFKDKANDKSYIKAMNKRASDEGVKQLIVMIDGEGRLGDPSLTARTKAVENHYKWVECAKALGCHSIRVNAGSGGSYEQQVFRAADGLRSLTEFGAKHEMNVIVENHGGLSSNGEWLAKVIKTVDHPRCGTLPDFGNFRVSNKEMYDRYKGVTELMPFAKAVSAKSHDFDEAGNETATDYLRMMKIVLAAGYKGYVGIEYEGGKLPEKEGIIATRKLLERVGKELA